MRKLAIIALSFSAAVFLANYIIPASFTPHAAVVCFAAGIISIAVRRRKQVILCLLAASLGFGWFYAHYERTIYPAKKLDGYTGQITAEVTAYPINYDYYFSVELGIENDGAKPIKAIIYDYTHSFGELKPGQRVSMTAKLRSADTRYGEEDPFYNSRDIYILGTYKADLTVIEDSDFYLPGVPAFIGRAMTEKIEELFPADTTAFMKALLIGDRSDFYDDVAVSTDFGISGFMHVVAVSGMHIGFLIGFIMLVFGKSPRSSVMAIALIWIFAFASGASPSVIRASFMQTLLLLAPIFHREDDPITTLSLALMVILMFNPYSASSLSLQLSFAAVAGIVLISDRIQAALYDLFHITDPYSIAAYPVGIAASSISVLVFTMPFIAFNFGYIQPMSIVTNILGLWAVSLCFCAGQIACAVGFIVPKLGALLAGLTALPARYIKLLVSAIADIPYAAVYLNKTLMLIYIVLLYAVFALFIFKSKKRMLRIIAPSAISLAVLVLMLFTVRQWYRQDGGFITALDVGQGQCITAFSGDKTIVVDCGGKAVSKNPGEICGTFLKSCGRDTIDLLILTHAHTDHANGVEKLLELVDVGTIIMPEQSEDSVLFDSVVSGAKRNGTQTEIITADTIKEEGNFDITIFAPQPGGKDNEDCLILILSLDDYDMLITGDSPAKIERRLLKEHELPDIETFIVAHHGSKYSNTEALIDAIDAENAIISVGYNSYGHPTEEVIDLLLKYGYNIYRTDENGNIQIRIDRSWQEKTIKTNKN